MEEKKFYCILHIHKNGRRGYIYETLREEIDLSPRFINECKRFSSVGEANSYIKENKLNNGGWNAHVRDEKDIAKEKQKDLRVGEGYFRIVNDFGHSAFYDKDKKQYYWKDSEAGCTAWQDEASAENFIVKMKTYFPNMKFSAKPLGD